ncbi:MAG: hypothetical protein ACLFVQ_06400 [Chitinispirillaceae bacterium]
MKVYTISVLLFLLLSVFSCVGPSKVVLAPDYKKVSIPDAAMAIVIQDHDPFLVYKGNVEDVLGKGDPRDLIWKYFKKRLLKDVMKEVKLKTAFYSSVDSKYLISNEMLEMSGEVVVIELPAAGTHFEFSGIETDLVLFISKIRVGTETDDYQSVRPENGLNFTPSKSLIYQSSFVLWDNRTHQFISYGRVKSTVPITGEEATESDWIKASRQYVKTVFEPVGLLK